MAAFPLPDNNPLAPVPRLGSSDKKTVGITKNSFEANYLQVRRTSTRSRKAFELNYDTLTLAEFAILEDFFDANIGSIFSFTHPVELVTYQVTFASGDLEKTYKSYGIVDTKITLESI
jgi:hypothetical protein